VPVSDEVEFNVLVMQAGDTRRWQAEKTQLRTCSVAAGKVKVKLEGKEFHLGPHGLFVVRPGQVCTVENRLYGHAVLHCTTVKEYELLS
jgi:glyoxylate utilization-related uncharacterized protein